MPSIFLAKKIDTIAARFAAQSVLDPAHTHDSQNLVNFDIMEVSMTQFQTINHNENSANRAAYLAAEIRSSHSYFNQHIIFNNETGYIAIDEGDYAIIPSQYQNNIIATIPSQKSDEY